MKFFLSLLLLGGLVSCNQKEGVSAPSLGTASTSVGNDEFTEFEKKDESCSVNENPPAFDEPVKLQGGGQGDCEIK